MSRDDKDWDKEFDELVASADGLHGIEADGLGSSIEDLGDRAPYLGDDGLDAPDLQKPENQRCIAVILTPVRDVSDLYALLAIHGVEAQVMQTETGAIVYQEYEVSESDAFEELLGDERPLPEEAVELAKLVSSMMAFYGAVLCVSWLSDAPDETSQLCGQVVAKRYVDQKFDANLPAGQLISGVNSVVEDLLLGLATPDDISDVRQTKSMSAFQAFRYLRKRLRARHRDDDPQSMLEREERLPDDNSDKDTTADYRNDSQEKSNEASDNDTKEQS